MKIPWLSLVFKIFPIYLGKNSQTLKSIYQTVSSIGHAYMLMLNIYVNYPFDSYYPSFGLFCFENKYPNISNIFKYRKLCISTCEVD
jgi:hypothetical protein